MTEPARRRIPRWVYAIPIVGALVAMAMLSVVPSFMACGGGDVHLPPPAPPPANEIAQTP